MSHPADAALDLFWQPERVDFTEAFRVRNRARKAWLKIWTMAGVALVVALVVSITGTAPSVAAAGYFVAVFFPLSALIIQPLSVWSFWRRNPVLHGPLQARVDPVVGITLSGRSSATHPWSIVHSFLETDRVFVVQLSGYRNLGFVLLAKRGLPSEWHVERLRGLLSTSVVR